MRRWGPFVVVTLAALAGAVGTLLIGAVVGMRGGELLHLAQLLLPAVLATIVAASIATPILSRAPVGRRFVALALIAVAVSLANLAVLAALMLVKQDALLISVLLIYSAGAGVGAALALSRSFRLGVEKLVGVAKTLGAGGLDSRAGQVSGGPELEKLAQTLDQMAERLQRSIASEQRALATRKDLVTAVSHDLRTPLAGLQAMVEAISDGVVEDLPTLRRYAQEMRNSVEALGLLIDDLFELVQLDSNDVAAESQRVRLDEVVHGAMAACGAKSAEKRITLETELNGAGDQMISHRMTRVLQNLLQNAIRHTPSDGAIRIYAKSAPGVLEIAVEDEGGGIRETDLDKVFEPFWRGDESRFEKGSGLGLALAKGITNALGGDIQVASTEGKGSRFAVTVPVTQR